MDLSSHAEPRSRAPVETRACRHCGTTFAPVDHEAFCCTGCATVYELLHAAGLARYYALQGDEGMPVGDAHPETRDLKWLEPIEARLALTPSAERIEFDLQGLHCAACVWLIDELFRRRVGALRVLVNPAMGRVELLVSSTFPLRAYLLEIERFGYLLGPPLKTAALASRTLMVRLGVCAALAINAMIFALPLYVGLRTGPIHTLFAWLAFGLTAIAVAVGGPVFFRAAWQGVRRGVLHLDLPISLGILLAFGGSVWAFVTGHEGRGAYFDTLAVFITLMLAGRWLQERVLERNRRYLLASDGLEGLLARRVRAERVELVPCRDLVAGDALLIAPGDVVPVDATLDEIDANCSLDWISGESTPRAFVRGATVPAGAFNVGVCAMAVHATTDFASSPLVDLLRNPAPRPDDAARATVWWQRVAGRYVIAVLTVATGGFVAWLLRTHDVQRSVEIATAILVVTCPCAFGLATPMAYELVLAGLRRAGLFVRSASFLDRAPSVRRVVFDKTGTLTTGALRLVDATPIAALEGADREVLYNLVVRSTHPRSVAVRRAFDDTAVRFVPELFVTESAGRGLEMSTGGHTYRLGEPSWASLQRAPADTDLVFAVDGRALAVLCTTETLRGDARAEVAELMRDGYEVDVLSGDAPARVLALAATLGVPPTRAIGGCSPEDKARWLDAHDHGDTLMVGDGINDALAVERAFCSGTPAIDRPFMPARTDFYVVHAGLRPIGLALRASRALVRVHRRNLAAAVAYNTLAVGLALAGWMSPLACAVFMPLSSLSVLLATMASLSGRSSLWRSSSCKSS